MIRLLLINVHPYFFCFGNGLKDQATSFLNSFIHLPHFISTICEMQMADCPGWLYAVILLDPTSGD